MSKLRRRKFNLPENIYEAALDNKNVYIIDNSITFKKENYFTSYYAEEGSYVSYVQADEINGYKLYQAVSK